MELKKGYKQTEVGMIPEDWQVETLARVCEPKGIVRGPFGGALKKETFVPTGFKVYEQRNAIYKSCAAGSYFIDQSKYSEMQRFRVAPGDFIVSCSGTIGCIYMLPQDAPEGVINQALLKLRINSAVAATEFFYAYFGWENFQAEIVDSTQGGAMKNLVGMQVFKNTPIALPPLAEQNSIASALSDLNAQLSSLDDLLCKKRNIKQAAMQELLTGKRRLPGFDREWETVSLSQVAEKITGFWGRTEPGKEAMHSTNVIRAGDISEEGRLIGTARRYLSHHEVSLAGCRPGDTVMTASGNGLGKSWTCSQDGVYSASNFVRIIRPQKGKADGCFIGYALKSRLARTKLIEHTATSAYPNLKPSFFHDRWLSLPPEMEQRAISGVLYDIDIDILQLEVKKLKASQLKQGMMQQLLTGKIRLQ